MGGLLDPHAVAVVVLEEVRDDVWVTEDVDVRD